MCGLSAVGVLLRGGWGVWVECKGGVDGMCGLSARERVGICGLNAVDGRSGCVG